MARVRKNADIRRQEILDASLQLFVNKGFQNVSIGDIAEIVGIARTTLYEYYTSKEQILVELVDQVALETHSIIPQGNTCREKLEDTARIILRQIDENRQVYYLIFKETPVLSAVVSENLVKWRLGSFEQVNKIISDAANELNSELKIDDASFTFQALLGQRAGDILLTGEKININDEAARLVNILWLGLAKR
jgi:AcrR family transcriptional regulator